MMNRLNRWVHSDKEFSRPLAKVQHDYEWEVKDANNPIIRGYLMAKILGIYAIFLISRPLVWAFQFGKGLGH